MRAAPISIAIPLSTGTMTAFRSAIAWDRIGADRLRASDSDLAAVSP